MITKKLFSPILLSLLVATLTTSMSTDAHAVESTPTTANIINFGTNKDDYFEHILNIDNNEFIAVGKTYPSIQKALIVNYDSKYNKKWSSSFGTHNSNYFKSSTILNDGSYVCAGHSQSTSTNNGGGDAIIAKYDSEGNQQWVKNFGGSSADSYLSLSSTSDGGFVTVGQSSSTDAGFTNNGGGDAIIAKYDSEGNQQWVKNFGGSASDIFSSITNTYDNGYIAAGYSRSTDAGFTNKGQQDAILVKFDEDGNQQWVKNFGGSSEDCFYSIIKANNSYIATGFSSSTDAGFSNKGLTDAIIVKFDKDGNQQWVRNSGGSQKDYFNSIETTNDGGFITSGYSTSLDAGFTNNGSDDAIIAKFDKDGNQQWVKNFGGSAIDRFYSITKTNKGYIAAGHSNSTDAGFTNEGGYDAIMVELIEASQPVKPIISKSTEKISITDNNPEDERKEILYKINNKEWLTYTDPFEPQYDENDICIVKSKSINIHDLESEISTLELTKNKLENDITVLFQQPHTLSVALSSNTIDFGAISGTEETEKNNSINLTVTSSTTYDINIKSTDDIKGITDTSNKIDVSKLSVMIDGSTYKTLSNTYDILSANNPKGIDISNSLNFKLEPTLGAKADSYSAPLKLQVIQK